MRPFGTTSPLNVTHPERCGNFDRFGVLSGVNRDSAEIDFSASNVLGLPNPIPLRGLTLSWQVFAAIFTNERINTTGVKDRNTYYL